MSEEQSERTVYIIGAGFSYGYDPSSYPLMGNFFDDVQTKNTESFHSADLNELGAIFSILFGDLTNIDVEQALAFCELMENGPVYIDEDNKKKIIAGKMEETIKSYLRSRLVHPLSEKNPSYKSWAESINPHDVIITFNYDWLIEALLQKHRKDSLNLVNNLFMEITKQFEEEEEYSKPHKSILLKLHGSLHWYTCSNPGCKNNKSIYIPYDKVIPYITEGSGRENLFGISRCRNCSSSLEQVIIYPEMAKKYVRFPKIGHLWNIAKEALSSAQKIIIIGYSFRIQDLATSFLMCHTLNYPSPQKPELILIDKHYDKVKTRLKYLLPNLKESIENAKSYRNLADYMQNHKSD